MPVDPIITTREQAANAFRVLDDALKDIGVYAGRGAVTLRLGTGEARDLAKWINARKNAPPQA